MHQITRKFEFDAGHRVLNHEGKCRNLHGHRYVLEVTVSDEYLDSLGRVIDFSALKSTIGCWIDENWDHNMILHKDDPLNSSEGLTDKLVGRQPYIMPDYARNPTVENLLVVFRSEAEKILQGSGLTLAKIRMYETPNCWAEWVRS